MDKKAGSRHIIANKGFLRAHNIKPRKSLGQHFLVDLHILEYVVEAAELGPSDTVVEIGAGAGNLTAALAQRARHIYAIEYDARLIPILQQQLEPFTNITVIHQDALKYEPDEEIGAFKVVADLPYYIATPLVARFLRWRHRVPLYVTMLQNEVADRLAASPGTKAYGSLTIAVQTYMRVKKLRRVPKEAFYPASGVNSALVRMQPLPAPAVQEEQTHLFFRIVKAAFAQRRKTLWNNLKAAKFCGLEEDRLRIALSITGIDPSRRGETLSVAEYAALTAQLSVQHPPHDQEVRRGPR